MPLSTRWARPSRSHASFGIRPSSGGRTWSSLDFIRRVDKTMWRVLIRVRPGVWWRDDSNPEIRSALTLLLARIGS